MKRRSLIVMVVLSVVTGGLFLIYWLVATSRELQQRGADIPTAWLILVPFVNYYWLWKHSEGVALVTDGRMSAVVAFIVQLFLPGLGQLLIQHRLNEIAGRATVAYATAG